LPSDLGNSDGYHVASQIKSPQNIKVNGIISRKYAFCHLQTQFDIVLTYIHDAKENNE